MIDIMMNAAVDDMTDGATQLMHICRNVPMSLLFRAGSGALVAQTTVIFISLIIICSVFDENNCFACQIHNDIALLHSRLD